MIWYVLLGVGIVWLINGIIATINYCRELNDDKILLYLAGGIFWVGFGILYIIGEIHRFCNHCYYKSVLVSPSGQMGYCNSTKFDTYRDLGFTIPDIEILRDWYQQSKADKNIRQWSSDNRIINVRFVPKPIWKTLPKMG